MKKRKKILISTFNMYKGGSLSVYNSFKSVLSENTETHELGSTSFLSNRNVERKTLVEYPIKKFNFLYRILLEQLFVPFLAIMLRVTKIVMLGNFPTLFWFGSQNVFFHNVLYLRPLNWKHGVKFFLEVSFFRFAVRLKKPTMLVQTSSIGDDLYRIFGTKIKIRIVGTPMQIKSNAIEKKHKKKNEKISLFYPAYSYPHKNHELIFKHSSWFVENNITIYLTIPTLPKESENVDNSPFVCLGSISKNEVDNYYQSVDGLLFTSKDESLGLPLLEAVEFCLPVIACDLPYVNAAISNYYSFDPSDDAAFLSAIKRFCLDLQEDNLVMPTAHFSRSSSEFFKGLVE
jgi:hypothetical protein